MYSRVSNKPKHCTGCGKRFTLSGYDSHLKQTARPACIAVREAAAGLEPEDPEVPAPPSVASPPGSPSSHSADEDIDPAEDRAVPFEGDHFGAYSADEFDNFDEYNNARNASGQASIGDEEERRQEDIEAQDDDEVDAANLEAEAGWEPPPPANVPLAPAEPMTGAESSQDANIDGGLGGPNRRAAQSRAHEHLQTKTHSVRFPSDHAGAPIQRGRERSAYEQFQGHIDAVNANPYAPFASRIDWEVARWAKTRGPGSTAVSELLAIEEVRRPTLVCINIYLSS